MNYRTSVHRLAKAFVAEMRKECPDDLEEIDRQNREEADPSICHSHDFCDANMVMLEACLMAGLDDEEIELYHKGLSAVADAAWKFVKEEGFAS